jgi:basic amino acid/polyamine antiporter, APA family
VNTARQLGLTSAAALVVASMIGTGVFTTSGFLLADLKSPGLVLLAWVLGGGLATLGALSYGALARRIPESGGEYTFLSQTLHPAAGFLAGWVSLLVGFSAPLAAAAMGFGEYVRPWLGGLSPRLIGTLLLLTFSLLHGTHVRHGARAQDWTVLVKVLLIVAFVGYGFSRVTFVPLESGVTSPVAVSTFAVSLVWVSFSYSGWNAAVYIGGEIREPGRNLPRALLLGTGIVTLLYLGLNAVFVFAAPIEALAGKLDIGRVAAQAIGGPALGHAISGLVALALLTSVSSMTMAGPRVYSRMAAAGHLPRWLAVADGPPRAAIAFQTVIALGLFWSAAYEQLLTFIGFTLGLSTAATVGGLIVLRRREGAGLAVPGWPWVPGVFVLTTLAITGFTIYRRPLESAAGLATLVVGWLAWRWSARNRAVGPT